MHNLYAPWRANYLRQSPEQRSKQCVFCQKLQNSTASDNLVFHLTANCAALLNRFPYSPGHLLIIPQAHVADLRQLAMPVLLEMWQLKQLLLQLLFEQLQPTHIEIGFNLGIAAGGGIPGHLHEHLLPRYFQDTQLNFSRQPVPLNLLDLKQRLQQGLQKITPKNSSSKV